MASWEFSRSGELLKLSVAVLLLIWITGCSTRQIDVAAPLAPVANGPEFVLADSLTVKVPKAWAVVLDQGTIWRVVGELEEGMVLKSADQVVAVNSFDVHEGYIVVQRDRLVGFYLPVTDGFVKVEPTPVRLTGHETKLL